MSAMLSRSLTYLGQSWIGTNSSDKGQCVGLYNQVVLDVTGILYPLQGANGAKDLITCKNTRPDLFQQIVNNPNDPNMLPQVGDWIVWGASWGGGYGHVACAESVNVNGFTSIEQNYVPNTVTRQNHNWSGVIGWVRYLKDNQSQGGNTMTDDTARQVGFNYLGRNGYDGRPNALASPQPDLQGQPLTNEKLGQIFLSQEARNWRDGALPKVYSDRNSLQNQVNSLNTQVNNLNNQVNTLNNQVNSLNLQLTQVNSELDIAKAQVVTLSNANTALSEQLLDKEATINQLNNQIANKDVEIAQLNNQLEKANAEIADLKERLKHCGTNITINFNFLGTVLWWVINKVGKK